MPGRPQLRSQTGNQRPERSARRIPLSKSEVHSLKRLFPKKPIQALIEAFPTRTWAAIQGKAMDLGLRRPSPAPLRATLRKKGDIGSCAEMVLADGSVMEALIDSGPRRATHEGGGLRLRRYFSMPQVKISMEDKEPIDYVARL